MMVSTRYWRWKSNRLLADSEMSRSLTSNSLLECSFIRFPHRGCPIAQGSSLRSFPAKIMLIRNPVHECTSSSLYTNHERGKNHRKHDSSQASGCLTVQLIRIILHRSDNTIWPAKQRQRNQEIPLPLRLTIMQRGCGCSRLADGLSRCTLDPPQEKRRSRWRRGSLRVVLYGFSGTRRFALGSMSARILASTSPLGRPRGNER